VEERNDFSVNFGESPLPHPPPCPPSLSTLTTFSPILMNITVYLIPGANLVDSTINSSINRSLKIDLYFLRFSVNKKDVYIIHFTSSK